MSYYVYLNANSAAAHHVDTKAKVKEGASKVWTKAYQNLAGSDHTPRKTPKGYFPARVELDHQDVDSYITLVAPNAVALEFGHDPSGWFGGTDTKPPDGEYILTRAAWE